MKNSAFTYSRFFSLTMLSGVAGLAGIITLLVTGLMNEHQEADKHVQYEMDNISRLLEEHAQATVQKIDLILRNLQRQVHQNDMRMPRGANSSRAKDLHALLKSHLETVPEVSALQLSNAKGEYIYSASDPLPNGDISGLYYFTRLRDETAVGLVISPLLSHSTGKWSLVLARRINFKDGSFAGVVKAELDMEHFQNLYATLNLDVHGAVALYDKDLHIVACFPSNEKDMGKIFSELTVKEFLLKGVKHGVFHAKSAVDGITRLFSFRQIGYLPLFITVGIAEEDYLAAWHRHIWQYSLGAVIFCLMVIGFSLRQRRAEEALRQDDDRFRYMLETSPIAVSIASSSGRKVLFANQRYAELIEMQPDRVEGVDPTVYYLHQENYEEVLQSLSKGERVTNKLVELLIPGDKMKWVLSSYLNLKYGNEIATLGWFYDITERKVDEERIRILAFYDTLTQLPNRRLLNDRLGQALAASKRSGRYGALMFLDLDNFKSLNDTHGHGAGDLLLIEVAHRINSCVRETDTVARFGGDEYAVVINELSSDKDKSVAEAGIVAEKIRITLAEPYLLRVPQDGKSDCTVEHHCTSSIGVVLFFNHEASSEVVLKSADIAMYQAKESGRNLVRFYESDV
jgi:diguanylate cyclase (GGDEF)-like protein/PAS domain S-box-containing protein